MSFDNLAIPAVLLIAFVVYGLVWVCWHLANLPTRPRPRQSVGHQRLDLSEERDPVEEFLSDALRYEADQQWLRTGRRPTAPDVHDVFGSDDD